MNERLEYDSVQKYFNDLEKLISIGNEQEIYDFVKSSYLKMWNNKDLFPRLYDYNLESIFNGLLYNNCLLSYKKN